ncbi:MAG: putative transglutaminase-like protein [Acidimicrobiales bacterium]|nr:MAG: putative transglutaminase-like protein [Acidimicrobiales bacterium]
MHIEALVHAAADVALAIAPSQHYDRVEESLEVAIDGVATDVRSIDGDHGGRIDVLPALEPGRLVLDYTTTIAGTAPPALVADADWVRYVQPSRYCESDRLGGFARVQFADLTGIDLVLAITDWVRGNILYVPGASRPTDGAVATFLAREGVCRDFSHLAVALMRANDLPARVVSVFAPGLSPMDFHAVTEVLLDGQWIVVDPTGLAPRQSMLRIATGHDAAATAFMTSIGGQVDLTGIAVGAVVNPELPVDSGRDACALH